MLYIKGMNFKNRLISAGFPSKRKFAQHIEKDVATVSRWGDNPPKLVGLYLDALGSHKPAMRSAWEQWRDDVIQMIRDTEYKE